MLLCYAAGSCVLACWITVAVSRLIKLYAMPHHLTVIVKPVGLRAMLLVAGDAHSSVSRSNQGKFHFQDSCITLGASTSCTPACVCGGFPPNQRHYSQTLS